MARKESGTILQEELYPDADVAPAEAVRESSRRRREVRLDDRGTTPRTELDDSRLVDLDVDEESPFLRGQKRVSARRSALPKKTAHRLLWAAVAFAGLAILTVIAAVLYNYGEHSWRFRIESSDNIEVTGTQNVTQAQIMEVMGADIGRNIFFVPLAQQKVQLEQIPWVESASVMRFVPNRLKVEIHERTPVAFARVGPRISLIDAGGTLMELPRNHKYSFPVILGMNPGEPLSTRAPRMKAYNELVRELDSGGAHYSQDLSEVDVSDLENLKVRVNDTAGDVQVELGSTDYRKRYQTYISHVQEWRQQFQKLESVNLRYENQVIVNPDMEGRTRPAPIAPGMARVAEAAGVKPAALVTKSGLNAKGLPKPAFELSKTTLDSVSGKKPPAKTKPKTKRVVAVKGKGKAAVTKKPAKPVVIAKASGAAHAGNNLQKPSGAGPLNAAGAKPSPAITKPAGPGAN